MKEQISQLLVKAIEALREEGQFVLDGLPAIPIERARDAGHGDFASPVAMMLARQLRRKPREIAELIVARLPESDMVERAEIAGPGFINFSLPECAWQQVVQEVLNLGDRYGQSALGEARPIHVEFVSANPTGPLHVGHGRGAAYGAVVANLLEAIGYAVHREYYVNDAGRQMDILALSVWLRYLEQGGLSVEFPGNGYRGEYIADIAARLRADNAETFMVAADFRCGEVETDDAEAQLDACIASAREQLGPARFRQVLDASLAVLLEDIREDLEAFGIRFDEWFAERRLVDDGAVDRALQRLRDGEQLYEQDGACWFRSTRFGDEKDRVVVRENGDATYFASDIAYHMNKFERGFQQAIDVWGADHHGYVPRVRGALEALDEDSSRLEVLLVQFAVLYRGAEKVPMSTRSGSFVTLRELRAEVGNDAARFFYVMRKSDQHLDFDLELAKSQSNDNPVYYVQYAHARICSVLRELAQRGLTWDETARHALGCLGETHELALLRTLSRFPEVVEAAALAREPHQLAFYLRELANDFHTYYNAHVFLVDDTRLRDARLALIQAVRYALHNGLDLLGVSAPEAM